MAKVDQEYIKTMLENDLFTIIYPKDKSEESAKQVLEMIDSAVGLAKCMDKENNFIWGVLIDKTERN